MQLRGPADSFCRNTHVVFHSLRHSSATCKLKLNHGDLKATQGDTGHAEIDMLTKVYAHILDSDRKITAQRFEEAFYQPQDLPEQKDNSSSSPDIAALIAQIQQYPELGKILSDVLAKQTSADENTENLAILSSRHLKPFDSFCCSCSFKPQIAT